MIENKMDRMEEIKGRGGRMERKSDEDKSKKK